MKKILVSGGAGYIGSHTVQVLAEAGYGLVVLDSLITGHREAVSEGIPFYQGDIAHEGLVTDIINKEKVRSVIHFAARSLVGEAVQPEFPKSLTMKSVESPKNKGF